MLAGMKTTFGFLVHLSRWFLITFPLVSVPENNNRVLFSFCLLSDTHSFQDSIGTLFFRTDAQTSRFFMWLSSILFAGYCITSLLHIKKRTRPMFLSYLLFVSLLLILLLSLQIITSMRQLGLLLIVFSISFLFLRRNGFLS
jgi:hypothetical protein